MPKNYVYKRAEDLGLPIEDSASPVLVTVTAGDVINAKKRDSKDCALSRAALRVPGVLGAYFFLNTALLEYKDKIVRFKLPQSVQKEIVSFDRAQIFAPGIYQMSAVPPALAPKYAKRHRTKKKQERRKTLLDSAKAQRRELTAKIERIAERAAVPITPEMIEFNSRIAGIMAKEAPTPLVAPRKHHHRTQYVRTLEEP